MHQFTTRTSTGTPSTTLTLDLDHRIKSRQRVTLDNGAQAGLFLDRGTLLRGGDLIATEEGLVARVVAAAEAVSTAKTDDARLLARACYHLGNRHTPVQVGEGFLRYQHDHVLDDMLKGLGLNPVFEQAPFEPEPGAYGDYAHAGGHGHSHSHSHSHNHD